LIVASALDLDMIFTKQGMLKSINSPNLGHMVAESFNDPGRMG